MTDLLEVKHLTTVLRQGGARFKAVDDVSLSVRAGEVFGLVGESGSGKSMTLRSILRLVRPPLTVGGGEVMFDGRDLLRLSMKQMRSVRGRQVAMIFQDPMTALNPVLTIGNQITEALGALPRAERQERAIELLRTVGIPSPKERLMSFAHEFSGGMRQRAMIAIALAQNPRLLLADEPTTALDVTIQDQILRLLLRLQRERHMAMILVSHDLAVVSQTCDRLAVMYAGQIVETAPSREIFSAPRHPYTLGLIDSLPKSDSRGQLLRSIPGMPPALTASAQGCRFYERCPFALEACRTADVPLTEVADGHFARCLRAGELPALSAKASPLHEATGRVAPRREEAPALLSAKALGKRFELPRAPLEALTRKPARSLRALADVDLTIHAGESVGLVGESGSGKSTLGRCLVRLLPATEGEIQFAGADITRAAEAGLGTLRRQVQMIFQDPYSSLNPRRTVGETLSEVLTVHGLASRELLPLRITELLARVGLSPEMAVRLPHELSGGQRQRVGIARALAVQPTLLIADEPVSALDVSIQAQIINLLRTLQQELQLAMLFISHDLRVVHHISERVVVMYLGGIVEEGPADDVFSRPLHPYTQALLEAAPRLGGRALEGQEAKALGEPPSPLDVPSGCPFHPRCPYAMDVCREKVPALLPVALGRRVACHLHAGA